LDRGSQGWREAFSFNGVLSSPQTTFAEWQHSSLSYRTVKL